MVVIGEVVAAVLQLTVVSGAWLPSPLHPSGRIKLAIYFAQVRYLLFEVTCFSRT